MIRVLLADDNAVIRSGLVSLLEADDRFTVVAEATTGEEAVRLAELHALDIVLLDVRMPVMDGVEAAGAISRKLPVLMLTYTEDADTVKRAIRAGASGYLVHGRFTPDELASAVLAVAEGEGVLSPAVASVVFAAVRSEPVATDQTILGDFTAREREIMTLVTAGSSNADIARQLYLAEKTVKNHLNRIYAKLGVTSRGEAMARWLGTSPPLQRR
jgi:DNA-binding NarL/FixJ family response regulator